MKRALFNTIPATLLYWATSRSTSSIWATVLLSAAATISTASTSFKKAASLVRDEDRRHVEKHQVGFVIRLDLIQHFGRLRTEDDLRRVRVNARCHRDRRVFLIAKRLVLEFDIPQKDVFQTGGRCRAKCLGHGGTAKIQVEQDTAIFGLPPETRNQVAGHGRLTASRCRRSDRDPGPIVAAHLKKKLGAQDVEMLGVLCGFSSEDARLVQGFFRSLEHRDLFPTRIHGFSLGTAQVASRGMRVVRSVPDDRHCCAFHVRVRGLPEVFPSFDLSCSKPHAIKHPLDHQFQWKVKRVYRPQPDGDCDENADDQYGLQRTTSTAHRLFFQIGNGRQRLDTKPPQGLRVGEWCGSRVPSE